MNETPRNKRPSQPRRHGDYSLMGRTGKLPKRRSYIRAYLTDVRESLIFDLGPIEEDFATAERGPINRTVLKLAVIRCIEEYIRESGVLASGGLSPILAENYITYCESLERSPRALGIIKRVSDIMKTPFEMAAKIDVKISPLRRSSTQGLLSAKLVEKMNHDDVDDCGYSYLKELLSLER
jgi:hypothetical protein